MRRLTRRGNRRGGRRSWRRRFGRLLLRATVLLFLVSVVLVLPWRWIPPPTTAFIARAWMERSQAGDGEVYHRWRCWDEISPQLAIAVVAAEDQKFPTHHGFDFESIWKATRDRFARPRGASTISQQVAKNLFLWRERSFLRKGLEAYLTVLIEGLWPKRRILEVYLNVAEFGPGVFGAGAASELLLGKPAASLTPEDSALLAAVLPSPGRMSARHPSDYVRQRAAEIEEAVRSLGGIQYLSDL
jgi:monofunctional biosynthetic peptidoglycan transglycosylase